MPAPVIGRKSKAGDNADEMVVSGKSSLMRYVTKTSEGTKKERKKKENNHPR